MLLSLYVALRQLRKIARHLAILALIHITLTLPFIATFHSDSPECKENPEEAANAEPSDDINTDDNDDDNNVGSSNLEDSIQSDSRESNSLYKRPKSSLPPDPADLDPDEPLGNYRKLWPRRVKSRDELCTLCLAIAPDPDFIVDKSVRTRAGERLSYKERNDLAAIYDTLVRYLMLLYASKLLF